MRNQRAQLSTRAWHHRRAVARWTLLAVALSLAAAPNAAGQGFGGRGAMPAAGSFFKQQEEQREVVGLSLAATDEPVVDVRVEGNKLIPTAQILNVMQTRVGRPYDPTLVQRDVRKLASRSWFVAVDPEIEKTPAGRIVTIRVVERPTIRYIEYLGNKKIRDKKLAKETGLKLGGSVDPYAVEEARRKITALYQRNGFNNTQVTVMEGNKPTDHGIVYVINEGLAQKVWKVRFEGNEFVSDGRLKTQIESKPPMMMIFKGFVDRDQIDGDVDRLTAYYRAFGFFKARVGRKLEYNEKGNWVTLRFVIDEGPRYDVRNVSYVGNKLFATESLAGGMEMPSGLPFEQAKMNKDVRWLKTLYGSHGYVFADIRAEPVFLEEPGKIDLVYHVEEGRQWRVGRIFVHIDGENPHTRIQTALNRLSIRPGQIVDIREIHASERRLQASSLFLTDPMRGISPKITYRIREPESGLASADGDEFRGQSPDSARSVYQRPSGSTSRQTIEITPPAGFQPGDDTMDVHLEFEQLEQLRLREGEAPAEQPAAASPPVDRSSASAYETLIVRTQSPYQAATTAPSSAPAAYPANAYQANQSPANPYPTNPTNQSPAHAYAAIAQGGSNAYGGLAVGATGPDATPVGHNAQPVSAVQPAQYGEPLPPPSGMFGPPTLGPPVAVPNHPITPIPNDPRLFPSGLTEPWARPFDDPAVDIFVDANEAQTGRLLLGVAVNSDAGLTGQILLDEQNFDWRRWPRSMEDVVSGRAWRGAGQRFRLEAAPGTIVQRYIASFQEPYLWDTPISFGLSGSFYDRRFEDWSEQRLGGRVSLGYQWTENDVSAALSYRGESVTIYDPITTGVPELDEAVGDNVLHGFKLTLANDTRDSAFFATSGHYAELSLEQVVGTFIYPRATLDVRQYGLISERPDHSGRHVLSFATQVGFTGSATPIYDRFYSGGIAFRGFEYHSVGPKRFLLGFDVEIGGEFMWVNSLEYLFPLTADDMVHGITFIDFGTVEENVTIDWDRYRVSPGFGLRLTIPAMGPAPIALDFAFPIAEAFGDDKQVFTFNIGFNR